MEENKTAEETRISAKRNSIADANVKYFNSHSSHYLKIKPELVEDINLEDIPELTEEEKIKVNKLAETFNKTESQNREYTKLRALESANWSKALVVDETETGLEDKQEYRAKIMYKQYLELV